MREWKKAEGSKDVKIKIEKNTVCVTVIVRIMDSFWKTFPEI